MAKSYDNRRSQASVFVSSGFILQEFKRNLGKGFYGDKGLEQLARKIILELWRRDPALLEGISELTAQKWGSHLQKTYGSRNFRKNLIDQVNARRQEKIRIETEKQIKQMQQDIIENGDVYE